MKSLGPIIDSAVAGDGIDAQAVIGLERIRVVLSFTGKRLAGADPLTIVPGPLDGIADAFATAKAEIEGFLADRDTTHIQNANRQADIALGSVSQVSALFSPEELGALVSVATEYRNTVEQSLLASKRSTEEFRNETENVRSKLSDLATALQAEQQKLSQVVTDYQRQFSERKRNAVKNSVMCNARHSRTWRKLSQTTRGSSQRRRTPVAGSSPTGRVRVKKSSTRLSMTILSVLLNRTLTSRVSAKS